MDSQVTFMFNFVLTVVGAFAFGYKAVEYSLDTPNLSLVCIVTVNLFLLLDTNCWHCLHLFLSNI